MVTAMVERAEWLARNLLKQPAGTRRQVIGREGLGKTSFLREVKSQLAMSGVFPIMISPSAGAMDAGCVALLQMAAGLREANLLNGEFEQLKSPNVAWNEKWSITERVIKQNAERIALLSDEPDKWNASQGAEVLQDSFNCRHAAQVASFVRYDAPCRRIDTKLWYEDGESDDPQFLPSLDLPLKDMDWGNLDSIARDLKKQLGANLAQASFLEMKLLVALASVTNVQEAVDLQREFPSPWVIARTLIEAIQRADKWSALQQVLTSVGLVRGVLSADLLQVLGADTLNPVEKQILTLGLLSHDASGNQLHPVVRGTIAAKSVQSVADRHIAHGRISRFYSQLDSVAVREFGSKTQVEVEELHHAASSGDIDSANRAFFVDQLHVLGQALSKDIKDYSAAANVFRIAIGFDDKDDYAHHYLAYNLDCMATDLPTIQKEYRRAIELNPTHPWWWSRWINFLITTGRIPDARREWSQTVSDLDTGGGNAPDWVYEAFHLWVTRLLLHRAQLDFSEKVLDELPKDLRNKHLGFRALDRLLKSMKIARDGRAVFPVSVPPEEYWHQPHLDFRDIVAGQRMKQWNPARIDAIDEHAVSLVVGKHYEQSGKVVYGNVELPVTRFNDASLDGRADQLTAGRFIEMAFYGDDELLKIRVHRDRVFSDPDLPFFDPPNPRRYLQKETASP